jgi:hypothetical protein
MIIVLGLAIMWQTWASPVESEPLVRRRRRGNPLVAFAVFALIITATAIDGNRVSNWAQRPDTPRDSLNVFAMMGHAQRTASPERPFEGGQASAIMGQTEIDLRNAIVPDGQDVAIAVHVAMGQIVLRVPDGWTVDNRVSLVMGEVQDRRGLPDPLPRRRGRSRTTDWTTTQGGQGGPGAPGAPVAPDAPGAPSAADASSAQNGQSSETGPPGAAGAPSGAGPRLVLTGSVIMGSVLVRS